VWSAISSGNVTAFNNLFFAGDDTFNMQASSGYDTLIGGGGNDTFNYGSNYIQSLIDGGPGTDTLNLGGEDVLTGLSITSVEQVHLAPGHSYDLGTGFSSPTVDGSALGASDTLKIDAGVATGPVSVLGGAGNDTFVSGPWNDSFNGGAGIDAISYASASGGVTVNLSLTGPQAVGGGRGTDTLMSVENITGSSYNDTLTGDANDNVLIGGGGFSDVLNGGDGNDVFYAGGNSTFNGGNGYDTVYYGGSTIDMRSGNFVSIERIIGSKYGGDLFIGDSADTTFDSGGRSDPLEPPDTVTYQYTGGMTFTQTGPTTIVATGGGQGTDTLIGFDQIIGSPYDDVFNFTQDHPRFLGYGGNDTVSFQTATAGVVLQNPAAGHVIGSNFADTVTISQGGNYLMEGAGGDDTFVKATHLLTVTGDDTFIGGAGTDSVSYDYDDSAYTITYNSDHSITVSNVGTLFFGTDTLWGIEKLVFPNKTITVASTVHTASDFNGDASSDILWQSVSGQAAIWLMNGILQTGGAAVGANPGTNWHVMGSADFDGDGKSDILWQNSDGSIAFWNMNGTSIAGSGVVLSNPGPSWQVVAAADFNGDGKADILFRYTDGTPAIWLMNGTTILSGAALPNPGTVWRFVGTGDFNGDGKADILWQNADGTPGIWLMNGTSITTGAALTNPGSSWQIKAVGDFNGDGRSDLLWQASDGTVAIWFMNGLNASNGGAVANPGTSWQVVGAPDFNGDGKADVLLRYVDGTPAVWLMNGATIQQGALLANPGPTWHMLTMAG
jgi:hypothetical protein